MKDFVGNDLSIGDVVAYSSYQRMELGVIGQMFKSCCRVQMFYEPMDLTEIQEGPYITEYATIQSPHLSLVKIGFKMKADSSLWIAVLAYQRKVIRREHKRRMTT